MSFPRYERYKDSGVEWLGEVPEHWPVFALKRIANLQSGDSIAPEAIEPTGEYPVYGGNGLRGFTTSFTHNGTYALIGRQGALCGNINYATGEFWASEHAIVVTPRSDVDTTWLGELLREMNLNQYSIASAQPGLSVDNIRKLLIAVPALAEQQAVGQFLRQEMAKIDALIQEQRRLIELLKEKCQAVISHAVTNGIYPKSQRQLFKIKHLIKSIEQGWSPQCDNSPAEDGEWAVLKVGSVNYGVFNPLENKGLPIDISPIPSLGIAKDDVLISRANTRELVGSAAVADHDYPRHLLCDKIYRVKARSNLCLPHYLGRFLGTPEVRSLIEATATGASQSMVNIGQDVIRELPILLPDLAEQKTIVAYLRTQEEEFAALVQQAKAAVAVLQERRSALISAAVTGKIDVRNYSPKEAA